MKKVNSENILSELINALNQKYDNFVAYSIENMPIVFRSKSNDVDMDYCNNNNIYVMDSNNFGGTIVSNIGDVDVAIFKREGWNVGVDVLTALKNFLSSKVQLRMVGNDLLTEQGDKVISYASVNTGDRIIYTVLHISFNPNLEMIKNICSKEMKKTPAGLLQFGVTQDEVVNYLETFFA